MVGNWAGLFKSGYTSLEDNPGEGRTKSVLTSENIAKMEYGYKRSSIDREGFSTFVFVL